MQDGRFEWTSSDLGCQRFPRCLRQIAEELKTKEDTILQELNVVQGSPVDLGGYYMPDPTKTESVMRPSPTFNRIIDSMIAAAVREGRTVA